VLPVCSVAPMKSTCKSRALCQQQPFNKFRSHACASVALTHFHHPSDSPNGKVSAVGAERQRPGFHADVDLGLRARCRHMNARSQRDKKASLPAATAMHMTAAVTTQLLCKLYLPSPQAGPKPCPYQKLAPLRVPEEDAIAVTRGCEFVGLLGMERQAVDVGRVTLRQGLGDVPAQLPDLTPAECPPPHQAPRGMICPSSIANRVRHSRRPGGCRCRWR
jgi:hypothetical protein